MEEDKALEPEPSEGHKSEELFQEADKVIKNLISGGQFGAAIGFDEKIAESLYCRAYIQYQQGRYEDASKTFGYIIFNDPANVRAIRGLASSLQMQGRYEQALLFLSYAAIGDDDNADAALQVVECLLHLGRETDAMALLAEIERALLQDPKDEYIRLKVSAIREFLKTIH